jgi:8-oxo-dGTP pyrophosphatase MutT (NUDIX family)
VIDAGCAHPDAARRAAYRFHDDSESEGMTMAAENKRVRFQLSVSVFMLLRRGSDLLCLRRARTGWMDGHFSVPAGGHDGAEPLLDAALRETREEVGVRVAPEDARLVHTLHCQGSSGEWVGVFFQTERWRGEPRVAEPDKHDLIAWCDVGALPETMIPYVAQAITRAEAGVPYSAFGWDAPPVTLALAR